MPTIRAGYCPREGYKVASCLIPPVHDMQAVTVPVRGIRLHQAFAENEIDPATVTVPVRGIRLHPDGFDKEAATLKLLSP